MNDQKWTKRKAVHSPLRAINLWEIRLTYVDEMRPWTTHGQFAHFDGDHRKPSTNKISNGHLSTFPYDSFVARFYFTKWQPKLHQYKLRTRERKHLYLGTKQKKKKKKKRKRMNYQEVCEWNHGKGGFMEALSHSRWSRRQRCLLRHTGPWRRCLHGKGTWCCHRCRRIPAQRETLWAKPLSKGDPLWSK